MKHAALLMLAFACATAAPPPPPKTIETAKPPPPSEYELALQRRPQSRFAGADLDKTLEKNTQGYKREGVLPMKLESFAGIEFPAAQDQCYRLVVRFQNAQWSELARRTDVKLTENNAQIFASGFFADKPVCAVEKGPMRFEVKTPIAGHESELGQGDISVEIWRKPREHWGLAAKDRDAAIAKETKGFHLAQTFKGDLAQLKPLTLQTAPGTCLVIALKLADGASFSKELRKQYDVGFDLKSDRSDMSAGPGLIGPGGVADFGCSEHSAKSQFYLQTGGLPAGSGAYTVQIWERTASAAQVRSERAMWKQSAADAEQSAARLQRDACKSCIEEKITCEQSHRGGCYDSFLTCVRSHGYEQSACGG